jgi:hypothetical protein
VYDDDVQLPKTADSKRIMCIKQAKNKMHKRLSDKKRAAFFHKEIYII